MVKPAIFLLLLLNAACSATAQQPQLLILGTAHLNNPGHDMFNVAVDDVLTPKRQAEIVALVDQLATFQPTHVALECAPEKQQVYDQLYADYRAGQHTLSRDEREQIGMRLAAKLNLPRVDCVDYVSGPPGPADAYDFMAFVQTHEETKPVLDAIMSMGKRFATDETTFLQSHPLIDWYRRANEPARLRDDNQVYVRYIAALGNKEAHPGANWIGGWHTRNIIIVENLRNLAKPGDRIFTLFGVGHSYLLHEFAIESTAFNVVDSKAFLR
jgi:hypothetical protein